MTARRLVKYSIISLALVPLHTSAKGGMGEVFGALLGKAIGNTVGKAMADPEKIEGALRKMTEKLNAKMPMTVDKDTRLDNLQAGPGARFTYNYTIVSAQARDIDRKDIMNYLQTSLKSGICSNPDMQVFFKNKVTVGYAYRAADGIYIAKLDISPKDCGYAA